MHQAWRRSATSGSPDRLEDVRNGESCDEDRRPSPDVVPLHKGGPGELHRQTRITQFKMRPRKPTMVFGNLPV